MSKLGLQAGLNQSFQSPGGTATANFVTESFFMTVRELHVGLIPAMKRFNWKYNSRQGHLYHYGEELKKYQKMLSGNFDIILGHFSHISRIAQHCAPSPHAPRDMPDSVVSTTHSCPNPGAPHTMCPTQCPRAVDADCLQSGVC